MSYTVVHDCIRSITEKVTHRFGSYTTNSWQTARRSYAVMLKQSYLLVSGNGRISPYTTRRNTIVILSQVLRENTAIYGHGGRIWQYTVVNESEHSTWGLEDTAVSHCYPSNVSSLLDSAWEYVRAWSFRTTVSSTINLRHLPWTAPKRLSKITLKDHGFSHFHFSELKMKSAKFAHPRPRSTLTNSVYDRVRPCTTEYAPYYGRIFTEYLAQYYDRNSSCRIRSFMLVYDPLLRK